MHGREPPLVCPIADRDVLGPAGEHVCGGQGPGEFPAHGGAAVDDQVRLDEAGTCSCSSPDLRTMIKFRSIGPALVTESPLSLSASLVGFRSRSIVAPETCISCTLTAGVSLFASSSPKASSLGSHRSMVSARYLPEGIPTSRHTAIRTFSVS